MDSLKTLLIAHNSPAYKEAVELRQKILRQPLSMTFAEPELARESSSFHVACYRHDRLAGCLILKPLSGDQLQMRQVAVSEELQGQGIGREMVGFSEEFAKQRGYRQIILHARRSAISFYQKLGYETRGDAFEEIGLPHMLMLKQLAE